MSCLLTSGNALGCRDAIGGVKEIYIANKELVDSITIGATAMEVSVISTLTAVGGSAGPAFYTFEVPKNSSSWANNAQVVANNGGTFYAPTVTMFIPKNEAATANTVKLLGQSEVVAIVKQNDGKYFVLGTDNGLTLDGSGGYASGENYTDGIGWTLTLSGGSSSPAYEVPSSLMTASILV